MPTVDEVIAFRKQMFEESLALISTKGKDYSGKQQEQGDTLFNLRVCEMLGIADTAEQGILIRLSDKFMRMVSLMRPGAEPKHESLRDTVRDLQNYSDYALMLWEERQRDNKSRQNPKCD